MAPSCSSGPPIWSASSPVPEELKYQIRSTMREVKVPVETSADAVPGSDLGRLRKDLAPDRLEAGSQLLEERLEMPLVQDARTMFQGILCGIAVLACLYIAQDIVLPVVLALVLMLLLQPLVTLLERLHMPKPAGALIALAVLLSVLVGLGMLLSSPAARWVSQLPQTWPQLQQKFAFIRDPVEHVQRTFDQMGVQLGSPISLLSNPIGMVTAVLGGTGTTTGRRAGARSSRSPRRRRSGISAAKRCRWLIIRCKKQRKQRGATRYDGTPPDCESHGCA
jgi:hypothetical protein